MIKAFKKSFRINNLSKCAVIEIIKMLLIIFLIIAFSALFIRIFYSLTPLIDIVGQIKTTGIYDYEQLTQNKQLFDIFIMKTLLVLAAALLVFVLIVAFADSLIIKLLRKEKWNKKFLINLFILYLLTTLLFATIKIFSLYYIMNITTLLIVLPVLFLLYLYVMLMIQSSLKDNFKIKLFKLKALPAVLLMLIIAILLFVITLLSFALIKGFAIIIGIIFLLYFNIWSKYYAIGLQ
ncbi:TPA: hypothetical protein HA235_07220 [Candidatus Woesearchaeota archaeon]|nr:hypothetical protein [Candidatus Woesearchaeota archaeon]HIH32467.1 hypothetical protein [Candidatus Woesearchaeota archaeon]HIH54252.1 hypothetical protein [Candidatus Woesearchaeota archaeon]HIJ02590.1 hypothetical protein [Candidatus Woesearchaeota archaeon]HIJ13852.1 hypothetical protein [Candidatus Woesearchaeota archaeon]